MLLVLPSHLFELLLLLTKRHPVDPFLLFEQNKDSNDSKRKPSKHEGSSRGELSEELVNVVLRPREDQVAVLFEDLVEEDRLV